jgi:hypothetical protein
MPPADCELSDPNARRTPDGEPGAGSAGADSRSHPHPRSAHADAGSNANPGRSRADAWRAHSRSNDRSGRDGTTKGDDLSAGLSDDAERKKHRPKCYTDMSHLKLPQV